MSVPCEITVSGVEPRPGSPKESAAWADSHVTRILRCAWGDRLTLAKELLGYSEGGIVHLPHEYEPAETSETWEGLYCYKVDMVGLGGEKPGLDTTTGNYKYAEVTAYYKTPDYTIPDEETYVTESLEPSAEFRTVSNQNLYWDAGATTKLKASEAPPRIIRHTDWVYTVHRAAAIPAEYFYLPGGVNNVPTYSVALDKWFAAETLLCCNPTLSREITSTGAQAWTITFRFSHQNNGTFSSPLGWNHFARDSTIGNDTTWGRLYDVSGNIRYIYPLTDFSGLIA